MLKKQNRTPRQSGWFAGRYEMFLPAWRPTARSRRQGRVRRR